MSRRRPIGLPVVCLLVVSAAVLSACSSAAATAGGDHAAASGSAAAASASGSAAAGSATPSPSASVGASTTGLPAPSGIPRPVDPPPSGHPNCLSGTVRVVYPSGDNPLRGVCVHVGARIEIALRGAQGYPWRPVISSSPQTVALVADTVSAGDVDAAGQAQAPGSAVLSATTRAGVGPSGPLTKRWELAVTVVP